VADVKKLFTTVIYDFSW